MNSTQLLESALQWTLKQYPFTTLPVSSDTGQRAIYKSSDSPDGGFSGSVTTKIVPCVIVECSSADPWPTMRSRGRAGRVRITIASHRDDENEGTHNARCAEVFGYISDRTLPVLMSDYPDQFTATNVMFAGDGSQRVFRRLESWMELTIHFTDGEVN